MAPTKTDVKAKRPYRKRGKRLPKKNLTKWQVASLAKAEAKKLMAKNIETKHLYDTQQDMDVSVLATDVQLTTMSQGTGDNEIIGTKARLTSLYVKYRCTIGDGTNYIRIVIFQDKDQNLTTPNFQNNVFRNGTMSPITALYDVDTVPVRYAILYDKTITLDADDPVYYGSVVIKKFPKMLTFYGNPTIAGAIASGHIYMYIVSDSAIATHPKFTYDSAIFYKDG